MQAIVGDNSNFKLGMVSEAVRKCNYDVAKAVEYLLNQIVAAEEPVVVLDNKPPPAFVPVVAEQRVKCAMCEVLNPISNRVCFVCEYDLTKRPEPAAKQPSPSKRRDVVMEGGPDSVVIPEDMREGLTQSLEADLRRVLWEEQVQRERDRRQEEELTQKFLQEEQRRAQAELDAKRYECGICLAECRIEEMYTLEECFHRFCRECISDHCRTHINDGNTRDIACPFAGCVHRVSYEEVHHVVDQATWAKYEQFLLRATLNDDANVVWCPKPGCGMAMYVQGGLMLICPNEKCRFTFCRKCKVEWHADSTCEQYAEWVIENNDAENRFNAWRERNTKKCINKKCGAAIEKNGGCNHMRCSRCNTEFCWLCMGPYKSGHFSDKPGGCKQFT